MLIAIHVLLQLLVFYHEENEATYAVWHVLF